MKYFRLALNGSPRVYLSEFKGKPKKISLTKCSRKALLFPFDCVPQIIECLAAEYVLYFHECLPIDLDLVPPGYVKREEKIS